MQATCKNRDPVSNGFRRWPTRTEYYSQYIRSHRTNFRVLPDLASCTPAQRILRTYHQIFTLLSSCMLVLSHASDLPEECCILHKPRSTQPQAQMWLSMTASVAEASSPRKQSKHRGFEQATDRCSHSFFFWHAACLMGVEATSEGCKFAGRSYHFILGQRPFRLRHSFTINEDAVTP